MNFTITTNYTILSSKKRAVENQKCAVKVDKKFS